MAKVKAYSIRAKNESELLAEVSDLKKELSTLRVAKVTGGAAAKIAKINTVRKNIARVLTVFNQQRKATAVKQFEGKRFKPLDQRAKKTRAIRRALTTAQATKVTNKQKVRADNFPNRRYAVTA